MGSRSQVRNRLRAGGRWIRTSGSAPAATPLSDRGVKPQATASQSRKFGFGAESGRVEFARDSLLEEAGFEPSVPLARVSLDARGGEEAGGRSDRFERRRPYSRGTSGSNPSSSSGESAANPASSARAPRIFAQRLAGQRSPPAPRRARNAVSQGRCLVPWILA
jgi:hypothetical protein